MCNTNNDDVIYNPTVQQLHDAFRDDNCEVWFVSIYGNHHRSNGTLPLGDASIKTFYIKRKPKIVAKYGDFEFTEDELPQESFESGQFYFYISWYCEVDGAYWYDDTADLNRSENKNAFLTKEAAEKWQQMLLSFQNNLLKGVNHETK